MNNENHKKKQLKRQREMLTCIQKNDSYLADLLGVTPSAYNRYKNGQLLMSQDKLFILNAELGLDFDFLFGNKKICTQAEEFTSILSTLDDKERKYFIPSFKSQIEQYRLVYKK
ncbi:MAG: helix-turn-helix domain-containing protein [Vallitaleaceae bacterium]|nr:helix-turn-helix domain-containing protein [Vallitaleaceae bacterium]